MKRRSLLHDNDGLALTEYLILAGLLTAGSLLAITLFGQSLSGAWAAAQRLDLRPGAVVAEAQQQTPNDGDGAQPQDPTVVDTSRCPSPDANANAFKNKPHCPRN